MQIGSGMHWRVIVSHAPLWHAVGLSQTSPSALSGAQTPMTSPPGISQNAPTSAQRWSALHPAPIGAPALQCRVASQT